ncbi:helix-turn-helix domain-containing protein, partial [Salmonella enterica]
MKTPWNELAKARMKQIGLTQDKLAEALGKTQGAIGHWLNGRREPS